MSDLKSCPFCGGEASVRVSGASGKYWIACKACHAKTAQCDTMQVAADAWNRREPESAEIAGLQTQLQKAEDRTRYILSLEGQPGNW